MVFEVIKKWFIEKINNKKPDTLKVSGIYMLYIENFNFKNNIIPFYIGKSIDIGARFQQHKNEIKKLIDLYTSDFDKKAFYLHYHNAKQSGKHLYSKIFYFLKENNLSIEHIKVLILEETNECYEEKEFFWINKTNAFLFGFNQLPFISQSYAVIRNEERKQQTTNKDLQLLLEFGIKTLNDFEIKWLNYGYNIFNLHEFVKFGLIQINRFKKYDYLRNDKYNKDLLVEFKSKFMVFCNFWKELSIEYNFEF